MPEGFLSRWSRLKAKGEPAPAEVRAEPPAPMAEAPAPLPTLADVAHLGADADFSRFVAPEVDSAVRRLALKKLFADPHFNAIDGLDIYMGDFTKADPIPAVMMAALKHARSVFGPAVEEDDGHTERDPDGPSASDPMEPAQADPAGPAGTPAMTPQLHHLQTKPPYERTV